MKYLSLKIFLKQIKQSRNKLKYDRKNFWQENKINFENNLKKIVKKLELPKSWKVYLVTSNFLSLKKILPFDDDSWNSTNLIAATKRQGFEIMIFFNRAKSKFLSLPGLIPLVVHELKHVNQAAKSPKNYLKAAINDKISRNLEVEAEKEIKLLPDEFRKEACLEMILYCYDQGGWEMAKKMADFLYKKQEKMYGGGYQKGMTFEEYEVFLEAKKKKNINIFREFF